MQFLIDHYDEILALLGTLYALVCGIVALTPTREDDRALARFQQRISLLQPRNVPGVLKMPGARPGRTEDSVGPMLVLLLCIAPLLGACHKSELRRHVIAAEMIDAALATDAAGLEAHLRGRVTDRIRSECPAEPDWTACTLRVAREESGRVDEWAALHNSAASIRDVYVARMRGQQSDPPQSLADLLDEALVVLARLVETAQAFGVEIDIAAIIREARR